MGTLKMLVREWTGLNFIIDNSESTLRQPNLAKLLAVEMVMVALMVTEIMVPAFSTKAGMIVVAVVASLVVLLVVQALQVAGVVIARVVGMVVGMVVVAPVVIKTVI